MQTLVLALEMSADVEDYICNPNNVQIIQDALTKRVTEVASGKAPIGGKFDGEKGSKIGHDSMHASNLSIENRVLNSIWKTKPRFNGFVFAINISGIQPAAFHYPSVLFDPSGLIIGQEDKLIASMTELKLMPKISLGAFVYHFKSVTVKYTRNKKNQDAREDLSKYHPGPDNIGRATRESENLTPSDSTADAGQSVDFPVPLLPYANYGPMYMQKPFQRYSVYPPMNSDSGSDEEVQRKYDEGSSATPKKRETVIAFATSGTVILTTSSASLST